MSILPMLDLTLFRTVFDAFACLAKGKLARLPLHFFAIGIGAPTKRRFHFRFTSLSRLLHSSNHTFPKRKVWMILVYPLHSLQGLLRSFLITQLAVTKKEIG